MGVEVRRTTGENRGEGDLRIIIKETTDTGGLSLTISSSSSRSTVVQQEDQTTTKLSSDVL